MKILLINLSFGIAVFLTGAVLSDIFRWRPFGRMFAYSGLIYIAVFSVIMFFQTSWAQRILNSKQHLIAWCISHTDPQYRLSTKYLLINFGCGIAAFALGAFALEFLQWRSFSTMFVYGSLIYIVAIISFILYQSSVVDNVFRLIQRLIVKCNTFIDPRYQFWMNKTLIKLSYGIAAFLLGVLMSEQLRWRTFGDMIAYGGLIYIAFILSQTSWAKRSFYSIKRLLAQPIDRVHGEENTDPIKPPSKLLAMAVLFIFPVLLHLVLYGVLANYDPCKGNPGCMAGSLSAFFFILLSLPIILLLIVFSLVQVFNTNYKNYRKYLKVNTILSASPFIVGFVGFVGLAVITVIR